MPIFIIGSVDSGVRLVAFLKKQLPSSLSARALKGFIERGACSVNGQVERFASRILGQGDRVAFALPSAPHFASLKSAISHPFPVLYEDEGLFICNKPPGISCDPTTFAKLFPHPYFLVHRLDRDTSGVLILAKTAVMRERMEELFRKRLIKKCYYAIVEGKPDTTEGVIDTYLAVEHRYQGQLLVKEVGKSVGKRAITRWIYKGVCGETKEKISLIECWPETGRTHQIRVHLSGIGLPILGDLQYGRRTIPRVSVSRCLLHAFKVIFYHPFTQRECIIQAPLPEDFLTYLT
jgi:RluA family pseudouridine synthase